jgi:hypothetical protein
MVAGCRLWGDNEEGAAQHQADRGGELYVEGGVEDRLGAGEARRRRADAGSRRQVDEEDDGEAEGAEDEDDPAEAAAALVAQHGEGESRGEQGHRHEQVGVGLAGGLRVDGGRGGGGQPGVLGLADLDRVVIDELDREQAGRRGEDREADRPLESEHGPGSGRHLPRPGRGAQQPPFHPGEPAQDEHADGPQPAARPPRRGSHDRANPASNCGEPRPNADQQPVEAPVRCPRPPPDPRRLHQQRVEAPIRPPSEGLGPHPRDHRPSPRRCYYSASLRLLFRSAFRRAREGLFHAPIPAGLAGRPRLPSLRSLSSPLHEGNRSTLRPCHAPSP